MVAHEANKDASAGHTTAQIEKQNKRNRWPSRQTQTGISHGAPGAERCRQTQTTAPGLQAQLGCIRSSHNLMDDQAGRPTLANAEADGGWRVHTAEDTPLRMPQQDQNNATVCGQGATGQGRQLGQGQTGPANRGSQDWDMSIRKCSKRHRLGRSGPSTCAEEKGNCHRGAQARNARAFEQ